MKDNPKRDLENVRFPGAPIAIDGNHAVVMSIRDYNDAAGAFPITPSTPMGEEWAQQTNNGHLNIGDKPLIFIEPEGEHAAAAVTAGLCMSGLRATNFSSSQGIAYMHEALYAAVGKRLPYVLNMACRAITKASLNVHAGHDDYHCMQDTGFIQVFAKNAQGAVDLNLIMRRLAEIVLTPAVVAQDGFLTSDMLTIVNILERELCLEYLGLPDDMIIPPTTAQKMLFGETRRRVPAPWDVDAPLSTGVVQNQDSYMGSVAAQRPFFFEDVNRYVKLCMDLFYKLTGRKYDRVGQYRVNDAEYVIAGMGSVVSTAEAVADYMRKERGLKVGVLDVTMFRPFPGDLVGKALKGKKVVVLERTDQPLSGKNPLTLEISSAISQCIENGKASLDNEVLPYPTFDVYDELADVPEIYSGVYGLGSRDTQPGQLISAIDNMLPNGQRSKFFYLGVNFVPEVKGENDLQHEVQRNVILENYPNITNLTLPPPIGGNPDLSPEGSLTYRMHSVGGWGAITTGKNLAVTLYELTNGYLNANPKYGSEKKGQATTYHGTVAPKEIRVQAEVQFVDVVLSPDPGSFEKCNPLKGLKKGGTFVIQAEGSSDDVWNSFSDSAKAYIIENEIRVFYVDGFKIASEESSNVNLKQRMQGATFQGAFFKASPFIKNNDLTEDGVFEAIHAQLEHKFGSKGKKVVDDNLRIITRGFQETVEIKYNK